MSAIGADVIALVTAAVALATGILAWWNARKAQQLAEELLHPSGADKGPSGSHFGRNGDSAQGNR